ncbi:TPA: DUF4435 domain-containing protein [Pasteurella multocida]|nr:DUF4435 domain-containing protein [Pasteurella multocida]
MGISRIDVEINELFATLKNSSIPTVLVEGKDDMIFYRRVEEELSELGIDILPAGNKEKVLRLREKVLLEKLPLPIAFIVDKDLWVNYGIPEQYQNNEIIMTNGYSIENDLFIDGELLSLLNQSERSQFDSELEYFIKWYALAIDRNVNNRKSNEDEKYSFRHNPNKLLDDKRFYIQETMLIKDEAYPRTLRDSILSNYKTDLRGKSLLGLLLRQLSKKDRKTKFSIYQLLEIGAARKGENFQRLVSALRRKF